MRHTTAPTPDREAGSRPSLRSGLSHLTNSAFLESLQIRDFRWMWCGSLASFMAMNTVWMTNGWLVLRLKDDSPLALALVMLAFAGPMSIVSIFGGAMADRFPRRRNIMWSQSSAALFAVVLGVLDYLGIVTLWQVLVLGAAQGSALAINMPSRQALISEIVPEGNLMNAISVNNAAMNLTRVAGPAMAGVLIIYIGTSGVFFLVAGTYLFATASMVMINAGKSPAMRSQKSMTGDIGEGFSYAAGNPVLLALIVMAFIPVMFGMSYHALLPAWAREALDVQSDGMGMLMMVVGIGALVGTLVLASLRDLKRRGLFLLAICVAWGVIIAIFSQTTSYAVAMLILPFMGLAASLYMSLNMTLMQLYAAPEMRGRMMSFMMMTWGVVPLSALPFGALAERTGTPDALLLSGSLLIGFTILFAIVYPSFRRIA